ncbi:phage holin family protein [Seonamhaeicola sp.]|uniref:phage holin family protein n=1 Tax=Seonamhaeicola sp. TaxID=1912245 RepID=UPI003567BA3D
MEPIKERFIELFKFLLYPITIFMFDYLKIDQNMIEVLSILMAIDSVLGGIKSVRLGGKWNFSVLLWGIVLKISLLFLPVTLALMAKALGYEFEILVKLVLGLMIVSEGYSIVTNYYSAKNKIKLDKFDVISLMLQSIRNRLKKIAMTAVKEIEGQNDCEIKK